MISWQAHLEGLHKLHDGVGVFSEGVAAHGHAHQADALQALGPQQRMRLVVGRPQHMPQQRGITCSQQP